MAKTAAKKPARKAALKTIRKGAPPARPMAGRKAESSREAARQHLLEHQDLLKEIRGKLLARAGIGGMAVTAPAPAAPSQAPAEERRPAVRKVA